MGAFSLSLLCWSNDSLFKKRPCKWTSHVFKGIFGETFKLGIGCSIEWASNWQYAISRNGFCLQGFDGEMSWVEMRWVAKRKELSRHDKIAWPSFSNLFAGREMSWLSRQQESGLKDSESSWYKQRLQVLLPILNIGDMQTKHISEMEVNIFSASRTGNINININIQHSTFNIQLSTTTNMEAKLSPSKFQLELPNWICLNLCDEFTQRGNEQLPCFSLHWTSTRWIGSFNLQVAIWLSILWWNLNATTWKPPLVAKRTRGGF